MVHILQLLLASLLVLNLNSCVVVRHQCKLRPLLIPPVEYMSVSSGGAGVKLYCDYDDY